MPAPALFTAYTEADINPPLGGSMPGYFRDRRATGTLDPLKAKVVYLRQGELAVALVACDLIGMAADYVRRIRESVARTFAAAGKTAPNHVWVHCTHTHTGGMVPRQFTSDAEAIFPGLVVGKVDDGYADGLTRSIAQAVLAASDSAREEQRITLHGRNVENVAHYRRYLMKDGSIRTNPGRNNPNVVRPAGEVDPRLHLLRCESARVLIAVYGMHPDCVGGSQYSADYPAHFTDVLRHALGSEWRVMFLNACCGNINHINVNDPNQKSGPEESRRLGQALALAALEALKQPTRIIAPVIDAQRVEVACRLRKPRPEDVREAEKLLRAYEETGKGNPFGFNELFAPAVRVLARTKDQEHTAEIVALRLGDLGLVGMPGEIFVELGREVEDASPFRPTRTIGLVNGAMGYIPTRRGYEEGGYEAGYRSARYEPDTGHRWTAAAIKLLKGFASTASNR